MHSDERLDEPANRAHTVLGIPRRRLHAEVRQPAELPREGQTHWCRFGDGARDAKRREEKRNSTGLELGANKGSVTLLKRIALLCDDTRVLAVVPQQQGVQR